MTIGFIVDPNAVLEQSPAPEIEPQSPPEFRMRTNRWVCLQQVRMKSF